MKAYFLISCLIVSLLASAFAEPLVSVLAFVDAKPWSSSRDESQMKHENEYYRFITAPDERFG
jgi:hypothetical protein